MAATVGAARGRVSVGHIALAVPIIAAVISGRIPVRDNSYLWHVRAGTVQIDLGQDTDEDTPGTEVDLGTEIGRASCRERVLDHV